MLADPFHLGDEIPRWEPPAALPRPETIRPAIVALERALHPGTPRHMQWCVGKLIVLPSRGSGITTAAMQADNFIDACGHFPDDLWSAGTLELLQTKTFRPSPAELFATISARYDQRKRMLERAKWLANPTAGTPDKPAPPPAPESRADRLRAMRNSFRRVGRIDKAAGYERELAGAIGRKPHAWANAEYASPSAIAKAEGPSLPPLNPFSRAALDLALAAKHRAQGNERYADALERRASPPKPEAIPE